MPKYPSNANDPSLVVDNVAARRELQDLDANNDGLIDLSGSTDTLRDLAIALTRLVAEVDVLAATLPGISGTTAGNVGSAGFTSVEKSLVANQYAIRCNKIAREALQMSFDLKQLSANIALINTNGVPAVSRYPSSQNRPY